MDFRLDQDQRDLVRGVRELLAGRFGRAALRAAADGDGGLDRGLWRELGEAGFFALRLPEEQGGVGLGLPEAVLLTAAEQVGTAAWCTDAAVAHAGRREQFGQLIGGFQAVKHLCAGMLVRTELARAAVHGAAVTADPVEIAGAKLLADEAAVANARDCLQVHGGMGFT
ncbi:acyl-CoA dehydrogenase family protein, partial [Streptomyces anthocyanicus]|uniref:acyl-CoA dehydrogenase family protein n=1 Tax=Streptomyces anthocyanicus TaxID=68174 RepID=UPI00365A8F7A